MNKLLIIQDVQTSLANELRDLAEPVPGEAEGAQAERAARIAEIRRQLTVFRFFPVRAYDAREPACPGALLELDLEGTRSYCLIVPQSGGLVTRVEGQPVQIVTPESPLAAALMGHHAGDTVDVATRTGSRRYRLVSVS